MLKIALVLATTLALICTAEAGGRYERDYLPPTPPASTGTVNNYYGPTTVYQGATPAYRYDYGNATPAYAPSSGATGAYGSAYSGSYAGAYADSYSTGTYGAPWGQPFAGGVGYSPYGYVGGSGSVTVPFYSGARQDPWNGYNGGFGNGYW